MKPLFFTRLLAPALFCAGLGLTAPAAATPALNTQCQKNADGTITGTQADRPFTIASVSKVFTTHWAVTRLGPRYRFQNRIHVTPLGGDLFDVHIEGDRFPYFNRAMYQFMAGELNRLGVRNIHYLTYDENFSYATDATAPVRNSTSEQIMRELRRDTGSLSSGLAALNAKALALENVKLPARIGLSIQDIHFMPRSGFQKAGNTLTYLMASSELHRTLKEMNRNSNNFAADEIYLKLSAQQSFQDFTSGRLQVPAAEIVFANGSGYPVDLRSGRFYNRASCRAVVQMMADLREVLQRNGMGLQEVMAVAGKDSDADGDSTVTKYYGNATTGGALIAKTGTVRDTLSLAGLVMTEAENIFFHTSYRYSGEAEKTRAYALIDRWVESILKSKGIGRGLADYRPRAFMPFDAGSGLQLQGGTLH